MGLFSALVSKHSDIQYLFLPLPLATVMICFYHSAKNEEEKCECVWVCMNACKTMRVCPLCVYEWVDYESVSVVCVWVCSLWECVRCVWGADSGSLETPAVFMDFVGHSLPVHEVWARPMSLNISEVNQMGRLGTSEVRGRFSLCKGSRCPAPVSSLRYHLHVIFFVLL